jgi:hypothetical protein
MRWELGDVILWREVWRGRPWLVKTGRVVQDSEDLLALYCPEGTPLGFPPDSWPWEGTHPWNCGPDTRWRGHGVLSLHRPDVAHAVWVFWDGPPRAFQGWYVNLAEPVRRTPRGIDTFDQELDIWVRPDGSYAFKDDEKLDGWIERGRWTPEEVEAIRAEGARIAADLDAGRRWWSDDWASWQPDPSWSPAELPPGWDS